MGDFSIVQLVEGSFTLESGRMARQSDGAVVVSFGDTRVLATVNRDPLDEPLPFFPLTVDYEEKFYAGGKIPGGFFKREGKPSEEAVLNARMIDRPIRPLFPEGYKERVHVVLTVLSADRDYSPKVAAMLGASAALTISSIPFEGPIAGVRVGLVNDELIVNPTYEQLEESAMDIVIAGTEGTVTMVEGEMAEVPEAKVLEAVQLGHQEIQRLVRFQREFAEKADNKPKVAVPEADPTLETLKGELEHTLGSELERLWEPMPKIEREDLADEIRDTAIERIVAQKTESQGLSEDEQDQLTRTLKGLFGDVLKKHVRLESLARGTRMDGRRPDEVRSISVEVGMLPRVHGSSLFTRGETQSVGTCTLGTTRQDEQIVDLMLEEGRKRFMLHYNFPPYCVGEAGRLGPPKRREIGHGNLAETAIQPMLPDEEEFPYSIRLVSEITESNGSSSMASVCSGTLALMDAGVPIKKPVAGIAMGLIEEDGNAAILTDIAGFEDAFGDMDFKVAGTRDGITAFQLDVKVSGISEDLMARAMEQAKAARLKILDRMTETLPAPRKELSKYAPVIEIVHIDPEKIGLVIGPGGKTIRQIIEDTEAEVDIEDDGSVKISGPGPDSVAAAKQRIFDLTEDPEVGHRFTGKVKRIEKFGAFVEIKPGVQGLVHVSDLSDEYVKNVRDVVDIGDELEVEVSEIDAMGRVNLKRASDGSAGSGSAGTDGGERRETPAPPREEIKEGHRYEGVVDGIAEYGAFVKFEHTSGLIHISNLSEGHVDKVEDIVQVGDRVTIEVARIDDKGRYSLKLINVLDGGGSSANGESASASREGPDRDRE